MLSRRLRRTLSTPAHVAAAAALLLAPAPASAQIVTDRPDFVESSAVVGAGSLQVESSVAFARAGSHPERTASWSTPLLLRWGVSRDLELRAESDLLVRDASSPGREGPDGVGDVSLGLKWHAGDGAGATPAWALLVHADLPSGSEAVGGTGIRPSLRAVAEWALPRGLALGVMPGLALSEAEGDRHLSGILGAVLGKELSPSLRAFGEIAFETLAAERYGGHVGTLNGGGAWLLGPHLQLDAALSVGITAAAPDLALTLGLSALFPGGG